MLTGGIAQLNVYAKWPNLASSNPGLGRRTARRSGGPTACAASRMTQPAQATPPQTALPGVLTRPQPKGLPSSSSPGSNSSSAAGVVMRSPRRATPTSACQRRRRRRLFRRRPSGLFRRGDAWSCREGGFMTTGQHVAEGVLQAEGEQAEAGAGSRAAAAAAGPRAAPPQHVSVRPASPALPLMHSHGLVTAAACSAPSSDVPARRIGRQEWVSQEGLRWFSCHAAVGDAAGWSADSGWADDTAGAGGDVFDPQEAVAKGQVADWLLAGDAAPPASDGWASGSGAAATGVAVRPPSV